MADLTDDQHTRLREIAECDPMELWGQDDIDDLRECLPALLDENDRLGDRIADLELDNEGLQRTLAENDRLRADIAEAAQVRLAAAQQIDRLRDAVGRITRERDEWEGNEQAQHRALTGLIETVRAEADVLQQDGRLRGALVLRDACDKAEKS